APDKKGMFWCSSNKGIFRFNPANGNVVSFTAKDGLQGNEFNRYHFLELPDGHFIFGGTNGYTVFHPDSVQIDSFEPPAVLSDVLVNNEPLSQTVAAYSNKQVSALQEIGLAYNQNFLTFNFAGLEYSTPEKLQYRYTLEGFDKGWVAVGTDASAKYTSIPPGHYIFKVNASNTSGIWSKEVKTIEVTILPPWWKTGWAYCLYLLLTGGIVYAFYRNWIQREKARQQMILKQKEAEQLKTIDAIKDRFFNNITHEFRTPLTLILAPLEAIQNGNTPPSIKEKINGVERNAKRLLQLINQLLDLAKLEASSMKVDLSRGSLVHFIQDITDRFVPQASIQNIALTYSIQFQEAVYMFDADKLQKIIQ
ncbi:MAG: hybrid sensor histidine kinase/response regulator, partial [Sphingobacteriaceae bacterium]